MDACLVSEAVAASVRPGEHGTTFGGAPLACAAIEVTLDIIEEEDLMEKARRVGEVLEESLIALPGVESVRGRGAWIGVVLDRPAKSIRELLIEDGYLVGTAGDPRVLRLAPPAAMPLWVCRHLGAALYQALSGPASAVA